MPRALSWFAHNVPALSVVSPVYVLAPVRVSSPRADHFQGEVIRISARAAERTAIRLRGAPRDAARDIERQGALKGTGADIGKDRWAWKSRCRKRVSGLPSLLACPLYHFVRFDRHCDRPVDTRTAGLDECGGAR